MAKFRFEISTVEVRYRKNFIKKFKSWYFLAQNTEIWAFGLKFWKTKASRKFQVSSVFTFWNILRSKQWPVDDKKDTGSVSFVYCSCLLRKCHIKLRLLVICGEIFSSTFCCLCVYFISVKFLLFACFCFKYL